MSEIEASTSEVVEEEEIKNEETLETMCPKETTPQINIEEEEVEVEVAQTESPSITNTINALDLASSQSAEMVASETTTVSTTNLETLKSQAHNASGTSLSSNETVGQSSSYENELNRLREIIREKENSLSQMEARLNEVETTARAHAEHLNQQFSTKLEETIRSLKESTQRDKNSMVMKYVEGEKRCIELNRSIELLNSKLNDANKERQRMNDRLSTAKADLDKMNAENDKKLKEIMNQKREMERLREQIILSDAKEKAAQMKLAKEIETHAFVQRQLEQASNELGQLKTVEISSEEVQRLQQMEQERKQQEISLNKYKETLQSQKQMNKDLLDEILQLRESKETWEK